MIMQKKLHKTHKIDSKTTSQITMIIWNLGLIYRVDPKVVSYVQGHFLKLVKSRYATRGPATIDFLKALYGYISRQLVSDTFVIDILDKHWLQRNRGDAFPKCLRFMRKHWKNYRENNKQFLASVLRLYSILYKDPDKNIDSIVEPYTGHFPPKDIRKNFKKILKLWLKDKWVLTPPSHPPEFQWVKSLRAGPNRSPAILGYDEDARSLFRDEPHLINSLLYLADYHKLVKVERLLMHMKDPAYKEFLSPISLKSFGLKPAYPKQVSGRLEFLPEGGGKTRVVALGDVYTQSACQPLHDHLMKILRSLEADCTFDQNKGIKKLFEYTSQRRRLHCFDLSNCTDRFPMFLQEEVIGTIVDPLYAHHWRSVMVDRRFYCDGNTKGLVKYSVGQPMGFLSSWPAMALTHHAAVIWSAVKALGIERGLKFKNYVLLGDDIVIFNDKVAACYFNFMEGCGVKINPHKSIIGLGYGEFCKRLVRFGKEVTPLPSKLLKAVRDYPVTAPLCFQIIKERSSTEISEETQLSMLPFKSKWQAFLAISSPLIQSDKYLSWWEDKMDFEHFAELFRMRKCKDPEQVQETVYRDQLTWMVNVRDRRAFNYSPLCEYFDLWMTRALEGSWPLGGGTSFLTWGIPSHVDIRECRYDYDEYLPPHRKIKVRDQKFLEPSKRLREIIKELSWQPDPWLVRMSILSHLNERPELWHNFKFELKLRKIRSATRLPYEWWF